MQFCKNLLLFLHGGITYMLIHSSYNKYTHWACFIIGGIYFITISIFNKKRTPIVNMISRSIKGATIITIMELLFGYNLNIISGMNIWDYSMFKYNYHGQICLQFSILWCLISLYAFVLDDFLRWKLLGNKLPRYK